MWIITTVYQYVSCMNRENAVNHNEKSAFKKSESQPKQTTYTPKLFNFICIERKNDKQFIQPNTFEWVWVKGLYLAKTPMESHCLFSVDPSRKWLIINKSKKWICNLLLNKYRRQHVKLHIDGSYVSSRKEIL